MSHLNSLFWVDRLWDLVRGRWSVFFLGEEEAEDSGDELDDEDAIVFFRFDTRGTSDDELVDKRRLFIDSTTASEEDE